MALFFIRLNYSPTCKSTFEASLHTFYNSCQLFLPARNRRPSWFSPLNQILRGAAWNSQNKARFSFPSLSTKRSVCFPQIVGHLGYQRLPMLCRHLFNAVAPSSSGPGHRRADWCSDRNTKLSQCSWRKGAVVKVETHAQSCSAPDTQLHM